MPTIAAAVLERFLDLLVRQSDPAWRRLIGSPARAAADFAAKWPDPPEPDAPVSLQGDHVEIQLLPAFCSAVFYGSMNAADVGSIDNLDRYILGGIATVPLEIAFSSQVVAVDGAHKVWSSNLRAIIGRVVIGHEDFLADLECAAYLVRATPDVFRLPPPGPAVLRLQDCIIAPHGIAVAQEREESLVLLAAHDLGLVPVANDGASHFFVAEPSPRAAYSAPKPALRELYARALRTPDVFYQYIEFYHVLENQYFEAHLAAISKELNAGRNAIARSLWDRRTNERDLIYRLFQDSIFTQLTVADFSFPYPAPGHQIYLASGFAPTFEITAANLRKDLPGFMYKIRCGIVHTKAEEMYLERTPAVVEAIEQHLLPDLRKIARLLLEG